jgi:hypothetical protein
MTQPPPNALYERTMKMLGPALERVATDPEYRIRLEADPLAALAEVNAELDAETRKELEGKRFSEFWAARRKAVEAPVEVRDLPPEPDQLTDEQLGKVAAGFATLSSPTLSPTRTTLSDPRLTSFAPPYVPVGPVEGDF